MYKLIKIMREQLDMSQDQFAKALGTTILSVSRWENRKNLPNRIAQLQLFKLAKKYNVDLSSHIVNDYNGKNDEHSLVLYHGSKKGIVGKIAPISREYCDFGKGFYCGTNPMQPLTLISSEIQPSVYTIKLDLTGLKLLNVPVGLDWAMLIAYFRGYMEEVKGSHIYKKYERMVYGYDVISGAIADDRMYRVINSFLEKEITDIALLHSLSSLDLGTQYVLKTQKSCENVELLDSKKLSLFELLILRNKSIQQREEGINLTDEVLLKYRREGRFFDEILKENNFDE